MSLLPILGGVATILGSLFKGKKTQYTTAEDPQTQALRRALMQMIQSRMGQPSAGMAPTQQAYNLLNWRFFGSPWQGQPKI
jgi:ribosomal protein S12 methylthiotransferase accessory factor YcaO